ncbi:hypothetical protein BC829DRAFT_418435 [Chytridium lagenaria]|nr:hypothetical protein BC829DRAFT_418435 [Chytridium lagenaria]
MLGIPFECTKVPSILLQHHDDDKENSMPGRENHREDLWRLESRLGRLENLMKECLDEVTYCKSQIVRLREHFGHKADPLKPSDKRLGLLRKSESLRRVTRSQTAGVAPNTAAKLESSESVRRSVRANWDNSRTPKILEERETLTEPVANQKRSRIWSVKIKFPSLEKSADDVVTKAEVTLRRNPIDNSEAYWLIARDYESLILEHPLKRSDFKETKDCDFEFEATFEGGQGGPVGRSASATNIFGYIFRVSSKDYRTKFMNELRKRCQ